jgi:hypothetical protein
MAAADVATRLLVSGRATAQAVSRWLPHCGGPGPSPGQVILILWWGARFLRVLRFSLTILIPPTAPHSSSIIRGWYNRAIVADVPSGLSLTPPEEIKKKLTDISFVFGFH